MNLAAINIDPHDLDDPRHIEITVEAVYIAEADFEALGVTPSEVLAARNRVAGVLGRLATAVLPWLTFESQTHCGRSLYREPTECSRFPGPTHDGYCDLHAPPDLLLDPRSDMSDAPHISITVPTESAALWCDRIRGWLSMIAAADAACEPQLSRPTTAAARLRAVT